MRARTYLMSTTQLIKLNSTTIRPPSAHAAMGARQMLLEMKLLTVLRASFQVAMCRLPDACGKRVGGSAAAVRCGAVSSICLMAQSRSHVGQVGCGRPAHDHEDSVHQLHATEGETAGSDEGAGLSSEQRAAHSSSQHAM